VVDEYGRRLHQNRDQGDRASPRGHTVKTAEATHKDDDGRDVGEVFRHNDRCPHEDLQGRVVGAARREQGEPSRVDQGTNLAHDPTVVGRERRVVKTPPLQVMKVPLRNREVCGDLHPVPLCFVVSEHGRPLEACAAWKLASVRDDAMALDRTRVTPEAGSPSEEPDDHQDEREHLPL